MTPQTLLAAIDADAPLAQRHLWLMDTLRWVRGDAADVIGAVARMRALLDALDADPALGARGGAGGENSHKNQHKGHRILNRSRSALQKRQQVNHIGRQPLGQDKSGHPACE